MARAASAAWLLRHELRLGWRKVGGSRLWLMALLGGGFWVVLHVLAFLLLRHADLDALDRWTAPLAGSLLWFVLTLMLSHAILLSVAALFDRGDLDLLLSSPLPSRTIFVVRGLGIAISSVTLYAYFLLPLAHAGLMTGHARLLAIYPTLASMALLATAAGLLLTLALVRLIGARRARTVAQVLGALTGAVIFLVMQSQNMAGLGMRRRMVRQLIEWMKPGGPLAFDSGLWTFFHAAIGRPWPLLAMLAAGAGSFWLVVMLAHRRFVEGTQESVTGTAKRTAPASGVPLRFRSGLVRTVLMKEWRLILRDPQLIAQTLLQVLYLMPLIFIVFRRQDMLAMVVPSAVLLSGTLTGTLAWITVTAEEAPELIGVAPVPLGHIRWIKVLAAMLPVWLLVSPLFVFLLINNAWHAAVFVLCLAGSTACGGMMQVWYPRQGDRRNMRRRAQSGKFVSLLEGLSGLGWAGVAWCLVAAPMFAPLPLLFAAVGPAAAWFLGESRREQGLLV
jgi:ABC-2 type transport system permease protein